MPGKSLNTPNINIEHLGKMTSSVITRGSGTSLCHRYYVSNTMFWRDAIPRFQSHSILLYLKFPPETLAVSCLHARPWLFSAQLKWSGLDFTGAQFTTNFLEGHDRRNIIVIGRSSYQGTFEFEHVWADTFTEPFLTAHTLPFKVPGKVYVAIGIWVFQVGCQLMLPDMMNGALVWSKA